MLLRVARQSAEKLGAETPEAFATPQRLRLLGMRWLLRSLRALPLLLLSNNQSGGILLHFGTRVLQHAETLLDPSLIVLPSRRVEDSALCAV